MILLSSLSLSGEGKESECMKWGRKYEHQFHMRQVQVISQQRVYSLSKSGYIEHLLKSHCDAVDRTHLKIEEYCWAFQAVWLNLRDTTRVQMLFYFFLHPHSYSIPTSCTLISLFIFLYAAVKVKNHNTWNGEGNMSTCRQWPEANDLCHTFLHVERVKKPTAMLESYVILAWP